MAQVRDARLDVEALFKESSEPQKRAAYACTVVNLMPIEIIEDKPMMLPSTFHIPAAPKLGEIAVFHVEECVHYIPDPFDNKSFRQVTPPHEMARSLCDDWNCAHIGLTAGGRPGLFWVHGRKTVKQVMAEHADEVAVNLELQKKWFRTLINLADADWEKSHNRLAVSDLQRLAATCLGIQRNWVNVEQFETKSCPFCTVPVPPEAIKCPNCKEILDLAQYEKMTGVKDDKETSNGTWKPIQETGKSK